MTALATGEGGRKPLARANINQVLSRMIFFHRGAGHPFDRKWVKFPMCFEKPAGGTT
jgi:hypothetical protein